MFGLQQSIKEVASISDSDVIAIMKWMNKEGMSFQVLRAEDIVQW